MNFIHYFLDIFSTFLLTKENKYDIFKSEGTEEKKRLGKWPDRVSRLYDMLVSLQPKS